MDHKEITKVVLLSQACLWAQSLRSFPEDASVSRKLAARLEHILEDVQWEQEQRMLVQLSF